MDMEFIKIALQLGAFGVMAWLVYQQNSVTIPKILSTMDAQVDKFMNLVERLIERDRADHKDEIQVLRQDLVHAVDRLSENQERIRERIHALGNSVQSLVVRADDKKEKA